jgi:hypothetical protein
MSEHKTLPKEAVENLKAKGLDFINKGESRRERRSKAKQIAKMTAKITKQHKLKLKEDDRTKSND